MVKIVSCHQQNLWMGGDGGYGRSERSACLMEAFYSVGKADGRGEVKQKTEWPPCQAAVRCPMQGRIDLSVGRPHGNCAGIMPLNI